MEVRDALTRMLSSPAFARAWRARGFLEFITEEALAGRADALTGYSIARKVFGKPANFNGGSDPLVRVEAGHVRSRLLEYYATTGRDDSIHIELPRGGYAPMFHTVASNQGPAIRRRRVAAWLGVIPALAMLIAAWALATFWPLQNRAPADAREAAIAPTAEVSSPRILVQPFRNLGGQESLPLALGVTEEIMTRLGKYSEIVVIVAPSEYFNPATSGGAGVASADYSLTGTVRADDDRIRIAPRLVDTRTGQQIWATAYDRPRSIDNIWAIVDDVGAAITHSVGEPYGPLFDAEVARTKNAPVLDADSYHCLLRFVFALEVISEASHARATRCFEQAVKVEPDSSMSWARLAALYRMEYLHDFNPKDDPTPPLERALAAARRAQALDPKNAFAHQELAFLALLQNDMRGFEDSVATVLALNPSADLKAAVGINLVKMGQTERGFALIDRGLAESPRAPPFFFLGYVVNALREHDYPAAYKWAKRMETPDWPLSQAMLAAVAALTQHPAEARTAARRLLELRPDFPVKGRELIARGRLGDETDSALFEGLALAGVDLR